MVAVVRRRGRVADLHALDPFADGPVAAPEIWWCDFSDAAIVLGSRQDEGVLDLDACRRAGVVVVHRRSGGGVVLLRPGAVVWLDVVLPHGVAPDDVRGSMVWIGERWRAAVEPDVADPAGLEVHRGGLTTDEWSRLVCFAGTGPGEVLTAGRKLVGLSQRRTRAGLRVQGLVHRRDLTPEVPALLAGPLPPGRPGAAAVADLEAGYLAERLAELLTTPA